MILPSSKQYFHVIVVLGAAVWEGGQPSPALKRRLLHGVKLWKEGNAKYIIVSGGIGKHPPSEAAVMKKLATATECNATDVAHIQLDIAANNSNSFVLP